MQLLDSTIKDKVLDSMMKIIDRERSNIIAENKKDLDAFNKDDQALYDLSLIHI